MTRLDKFEPARAGETLVEVDSSGGAQGGDFVVESLQDPVSLRDRFDVLRRKWYIVLGIAVLITGGAAYNARKAQPVFRALTTVRFNDQRSELTGGVGSQSSNAWSWSVDPVKSQVELLGSLSTAEEAVDEGKLQLRAINGAPPVDIVTDFDGKSVAKTDTLRLTFGDSTYVVDFRGRKGTAAYGTRVSAGAITAMINVHPQVQSAAYEVIPRSSAIEALQGGLKANRRSETDISDIMFENTDPVYAQRAVNAATLSLQALNLRTSQQSARSRREFLDRQLRKADSTLEYQRARLSAFRSATQAYSSKEKIASEQASLASIRVRREELRADRNVLASLLAKARQSAGSADMKSIFTAPAMQDNPLIAQLYGQLSQLRAARDSLTSGPFASANTNPDLVRLNGMIESTNTQFLNAVDGQIETLDERIKALDALSNQSAAEVSALPKTEAEEERLLQEAEATQKLTDQLREEQQRARISEVAQVGEVEVIDLARVPSAPVNRSQSRSLVFALLLGLVIGSAAALLIDGMNMSLRRMVDVERTLRLPTLGAIPELGGKGEKKRLAKLPSMLPAKLNSNGGASHLLDPESPAFESFRALRTSLIFSNAVHSLRSIVVTSAAPGDGKSTTSVNLAAAFAQQGMRVLLVDCDLRRGKMHRFFDFSRSPGFTDVIVGKSTIQESVRESVTPNLFVLTSGKNPPNPTELLGSSAAHQVLSQLSSLYEMVIIDTPPVLAAADAAVLGSMVDGVIMIVRVGTTDRRAAKRAIDRLRVVNARLLGTVLNDPKEMLGSSEDYYYYYHYQDAG